MERAPELELLRFMEIVCSHDSIGMPEICVYSVLFQLWVRSGYENPVSMSRSTVMKLSKVRSKTTYHKCIGILVKTGFIQYHPSFKPKGSMVILKIINPNSKL